MSVRFYSNNLVWHEDTSINASTENSFFTSENLQDFRRTKTWKSTSGSGNIVIDFGSAKSFDSAVIVGHPINGFGFDTPVTIEANSSDVWLTPAFSTTIEAADLDSDFGFAFKDLGAQSYQYVRISFTASSEVEVSNIFIGEEIHLEDNDFDLGWKFKEDDRSRAKTNRYGQRFIDTINKQRTISGDISYMNKIELDQILELNDTNSIRTPLFFRMDGANIINNSNRIGGMFYLSRNLEFVNVSPGLWNTSISLIEAM